MGLVLVIWRLRIIFKGSCPYLLGATQKLPVDKARIKSRPLYPGHPAWIGFGLILRIKRTSNSIISQFQDKTLLKLRISYNKVSFQLRFKAFTIVKSNGWQDLFYIDYPYANQVAFEQAQDVYIQNIQYLEAHPKEETGD